MTERITPVESVTEGIVSSGLVRAIGLDLIGLVALAAIGVSVYRLTPDLVWAYAGLLLLAVWWSVGQAQARARAAAEAKKARE